MTTRKTKAPGQHYRDGISLLDLFRMIPTEDAAEHWYINARWPNGVQCPHCDGSNIHERKGRKPQRFRCRSCRKYFSAKVGTTLHASKLSYQDWIIGLYLMDTNLKGVSSMRLHRELKVKQQTAWHMAHRIRKMWEESGNASLFGAVEVDETYVGGKAGNMHKMNRKKARNNKTIVIGAKERATKKVVARTIRNVSAEEIGAFLCDTVEEESTLYTDQNPSYAHHVEYHADYDHFPVNHSVGEYVNGMAHTNGIESFWAMLKRGYMGTYHRMSKKHMNRYVAEFQGRHNMRSCDTMDQLKALVGGSVGKRLRYDDLTGKPRNRTKRKIK